MVIKKGFTLIELIIVMGIMSILASVIIPNYKYYIDKSKNECIKSQGNQIFQVIIFSYENNDCEISEVQMERDLKDILNENIRVNKSENKLINLIFNYDNTNYKLQANLSLYNYKIFDTKKGEIICEGT